MKTDFGVYIHWPFCAAKCPYCDFNSHVRDLVAQDRWCAAFVRAIETAADALPDRRINTIFFGGGTPSLMPVATVEAILGALQSRFQFSNDMEISLEANPTSADQERFAGYREVGVNRLSLGVQALDNANLKALGRLHTVEEALDAFEMARSIFGRVSFDVIYALQGQSIEDWRGELQNILSLEPDHVSLYQLTIEQGTRFGDLFNRGRLKGLPDENLSADMYEVTQDLCNSAGLPAYEVSNHARAGHECRHNMIYWSGGDYLGIGPGAHGRLSGSDGRVATVDLKHPEKWLAQVESLGHGKSEETALSPRDVANEYVMMALRTSRGINKEYLNGLGRPLNEGAMRSFLEDGYLIENNEFISATEKGRMVLNALLRELL